MWSNAHGDLMAVRYLAAKTNGAEIKDKLRDLIEPDKAGLVFRPVRETALRAVNESMDLGQLFLGMSIFLVAASLILTAMFFVFSVRQRAREMGVLAASAARPPRCGASSWGRGVLAAVVDRGHSARLGIHEGPSVGLGTAWRRSGRRHV
jgi:hypothetical protein